MKTSKRITGIILSMAMIIGAAVSSSVVASAASDYTGDIKSAKNFSTKYNASGFNISIDDITAKSGDTVDVAVRVNNNSGIASGTIGLKYDKRVMTPVIENSVWKVENNGILSGKATVTSGAETADPDDSESCVRVFFVTESNADITGNGVLFTGKFKIKDNLESGTKTKIAFQNAYKATDATVVYPEIFTDINGKSLDSTLTCKEAVVTVSGNDSVLYGDANNDGYVTTADVLIMNQKIAGITVSSFNAKNADLNLDGEIKTDDVLTLTQYLAGIKVAPWFNTK